MPFQWMIGLVVYEGETQHHQLSWSSSINDQVIMGLPMDDRLGHQRETQHHHHHQITGVHPFMTES
jgi:hypothetical protein